VHSSPSACSSSKAGAEDLGHRPLQQHQAGLDPLLDDGPAQALAYQFIAQPAFAGIAGFTGFAGACFLVAGKLRGCWGGSCHSCFICMYLCTGRRKGGRYPAGL
jgi:hypothetical protein